MTNILLALAMFVCAALIDFAYARQTIATTNGRALVSANWRALSYSLGCFGWLVAVKIGVWLLPFELVGLYMGTLLGVGRTAGERSQAADASPLQQPPRQSGLVAFPGACRSRRQRWHAAVGAIPWVLVSETVTVPMSCRRQESRRSCLQRRLQRRT